VPRDGERPGAVPSFSVIVAAFEAADTLAEAVASALAQTLAPLEVIVCDDGSTDDPARVLAPFGDRVRLLRREHGGEGAAKDTAARAAAGEFVVVLDADDVYLPERLQALAELATVRPDLDLLTTDAFFESEGRRVGRFYEHNDFPVDDQRAAILERNFVIGHAAVRRSALLAAGGFDPAMPTVADWDCWIRLLLSGAAAGLVEEPLSVYRLRPGSLASRRAEALRARAVALERNASHPGLTPPERDVLARSLARHRRRAEQAELEAALRGLLPRPRRRAARLAAGRGFPLRTRLVAAAAIVAPRAAGRRLARSGRSALARPLEEPVSPPAAGRR
jgi:hypothetical protein